MTTEQLIKYIDNRIAYIEQHCLITEDYREYTDRIYNTLMEGRLDELRDLKAAFTGELNGD